MRNGGVKTRLGRLARGGLRLIGQERPRFGGWIDVATWLSDDGLLLLGWFAAPEGESVPGAFLHEGREVPLEMRVVEYSRSDVATAGPRAGKVAVARLKAGTRVPGAFGPLIVRSRGGATRLGPDDLSETMTTVANFAERLSALEPETRRAVFDFLSSPEVASGANADMRRNVFVLREAIRESLPAAVRAHGTTPELVVDALLGVDDRRFCLIGWMRPGQAPISSVTVVSPEGERVGVLDRVFRVARPDVEGPGPTGDHAGFRCAVELSKPTQRPDGWAAELRDEAGNTIAAPAPAAIVDVFHVRGAILSELARERFPTDDLMERHYAPLLQGLQERLDQAVEPTDVLQFGKAPESPPVSIVVPLYEKVHFLEQQLAQFTSDPEVRSADLIYVLDSPELADDLRTLAGHLWAIYDVPFRLAILPRNVGFARVNNIGAGLARAPLVLLCNSDVLPDTPGWLGRMAAFYRSTPGVGAVAPKLMFEDDSLQHAGMYFRATEEPGIWENLHYFKGLHRDTPAANVTRRVPAVTAACLMIDRELFQSVGGLRSMYIQGDYEDSDLCLRLAEAGYDNWYLADVELYHLEGQSYPSSMRAAASRYNRWLHSKLWGEQIARLTVNGGNTRTTGEGRTTDAVEILEVIPSRDSSQIRLQVDTPTPGMRTDRFSFDLSGWTHGDPRAVHALELRRRRTILRRLPVNKSRPDVAAALPDIRNPDRIGFAASVNVLGLPTAFELSILAVLEDHTRVPMGTIRGRRALLAPPTSQGLEPLLITTYGRTGSTHLVHLLGMHHEILHYGLFSFEPRLVGYWTQVLRRLSEPASYTQSLGTILSSEQWWLGSDDVPPVHPPDVTVQEWLERDAVNGLAGFCRERVREFYRRVAALQARRNARFFVEKGFLSMFDRNVTLELFPNSREIFLVRDFRDMICSILSYNKRMNTPGFGREHVKSDEEFVAWVRRAADELWAAYQESDGRALLVRYEDMIASPQETLEKILTYLEIESGPTTIQTMIERAEAGGQNLRGQHVTSASVAGSIGRWQQDLDARMKEVCGDAFHTILPAFGYS